MQKMKRKELLFTISVFILFYICVIMIVDKFCLLDFDAAMNYQVVKSVSESGEYSSLYLDYGYNATDSLKFDHKIQTGSTIIFPAALLNILFGQNATHLQMILCLLWVGLLFVLYKLVKENTNMIYAIATALFLIPYTAFNPVYGYGEMAMAFFIVSAFVVFSCAREKQEPKLFLICGVIAGFGYLTKTVFLICIPTYVIFFVYDIIKKRKFTYYFIIFAGFLIPIFAFETYKCISLGGFKTYVEWWVQEIACIRTESGTRDEVGKISVRIIENIKWYANTFNINSGLVIVALFGPAALFITCHIKKWEYNKLFLMFYMCFMTYMTWWLLVVTGSRLSERRIMTANCLSTVVLVYCICYLADKILSRWKAGVMAVVVSILLVLGFARFDGRLNGLINAINTKQATQEAVDFLSTVESDATYWGRGWWQNPVIASEKGIVIHNLDTEELTDNSYFIEDVFMKVCSETLEEVKRDYYCEELFRNDKYVICKIYKDRDAKIMETGNYIRVEAFMPYWGNIVVTVNDSETESTKFNCMMDHILIPISSTNVYKINMEFVNYQGCESEIKDVKYYYNGQVFDLLNTSAIESIFVNEIGE